MPRPRRIFIRGKKNPRIYPSLKYRIVTYVVKGKRVEVKQKLTGEWQPVSTELLHMEPIQDLIDIALWTNWVAEEHPVSLLLYADYESGKTEQQKKFYHNKGVTNRRRFTSTGIKKSLLEGRIRINSELKAGHTFIPDMSNVFTYKPSVCKKNMLFIDAYTEEGLDPEDDYFNNPDEGKKIAGVRGGIIAGLNPSGFLTSRKRVIRQEFVEGGGMSRFIMVSWDDSDYSREIGSSITAGLYRKQFVKNVQIDFPKDPMRVWIPRKLAQKIEILAQTLTEDLNEDFKKYGIPAQMKGRRLQKRLISLVKACALREGRKYVLLRDVARIQYLSRWMNLKLRMLPEKYPKTFEGKEFD